MVLQALRRDDPGLRRQSRQGAGAGGWRAGMGVGCGRSLGLRTRRPRPRGLATAHGGRTGVPGAEGGTRVHPRGRRLPSAAARRCGAGRRQEPGDCSSASSVRWRGEWRSPAADASASAAGLARHRRLQSRLQSAPRGFGSCLSWWTMQVAPQPQAQRAMVAMRAVSEARSPSRDLQVIVGKFNVAHVVSAGNPADAPSRRRFGTRDARSDKLKSKNYRRAGAHPAGGQ